MIYIVSDVIISTRAAMESIAAAPVSSPVCIWLRRRFLSFDVIWFGFVDACSWQPKCNMPPNSSTADVTQRQWIRCDRPDYVEKRNKIFRSVTLSPPILKWLIGPQLNYAGWIVARTVIHHGGPPIFWKHKEENFFFGSACALRSIWFHCALGDNVPSPSTYVSYRRAEARSSKSFG